MITIRFSMLILFTWPACSMPVMVKPAISGIIGNQHNSPDSIAWYTKKIRTEGINVLKYLPAGFVKDGSVDYTKYITRALQENRLLIFPPFPLLVNESGLDVLSESGIYFETGGMLKMKPTTLGFYQILRVYKVRNVVIVNANIRGDRDNHPGRYGEWGIGIAIMEATNVKLYNCNVSRCWGDGVYISGRGKEGYSSDVELIGGLYDKNRRNGISIISARNLTLKDLTVSNTGGINPGAGIQIEPNDNNEVLENINLLRVKTINSMFNGIGIYLGSFKGSKLKQISIRISEHTDIGSVNAMGCYKFKETGVANVVAGKIIVDKPQWPRNSNLAFYSDYGNSHNAVKVEINDPKIMLSKSVKENSTALQKFKAALEKSPRIKVNINKPAQ